MGKNPMEITEPNAAGFRLLRYGMQTNKGQSGSPLFTTLGGNDLQIHGVHNNNDPDGGKNIGTTVKIPAQGSDFDELFIKHTF